MKDAQYRWQVYGDRAGYPFACVVRASNPFMALIAAQARLAVNGGVGVVSVHDYATGVFVCR